MLFGRHEMDIHNNIHISNVNLQSNYIVNLFGITIYRKLNFNKHANNILNKGTRASGMVRRDRYILSQKF